MKIKYIKLITCLCAINGTIAFAGPADYVFTPGVEYGEREIDFKFGSARQQDGTRTQVTSLGLGYGVTQYWFTEIYLKRERAGSDGLSVAEWENKFQLTDAGKYPVDVGLITEFEAPVNDANEPYEFKFGPLFQTEFGKLQMNGNLLFERKFGRGVGATTEIGYQWQAKYRAQAVLELGAQGIGEMGAWNAWDKQDSQYHRVGPAVFGEVGLGNHQAIKYNGAWLIGARSAAPKNTFRMQAEFEF